MWDEGIELAKTAYALDEALETGDANRVAELSKLLSSKVKNEVSGRAEAEGWYEEFNRATSAEHWKVETTVDPYGPAAFPLRVIPAEETRERVTTGDSQKVSFDWDLIARGLEQGLITTSVGDDALWVTINGYEFNAQEQGEFYVEKDDGDVSRNDIINSILDTLDLIEREPNDPFSASLISCVTYLNEHVDRSIESVSDLGVPTVSYKSDYTGETYLLALYTDRYQTGNNLALAAIDLTEPIEDDYVESWGTLTVNLPDDPVAASWCAQDGNIILDTNNNSLALVDALESAGIIEFSGKFTRSGFCDYPLATVAPDVLSRLKDFRETIRRIEGRPSRETDDLVCAVEQAPSAAAQPVLPGNQGGSAEFLSVESVVDHLKENGNLYCPNTGTLIEPFIEGYSPMEVYVHKVEPPELRSRADAHPEREYTYELLDGQTLRYSIPIPNPNQLPEEIMAYARAAAGNPRWVSATTPDPACFDRIERALALNDDPRSADWLLRALEEYRGKTGWQGLNADTAIVTFCHFATSRECTTRPTQHDQLRLNTPDGELVASVLEQGDYRSIVIDLERNGNSGQVAMVEWASEEVRGPGVEFIYDEGGMVQAVPGSEPLYPTPFHTFAYNGNDDDPTSVVSLDPDGREMFYLPRGRDRDAIRGNEPLSTQATRASSLGGRTGAAPSRHGELQAPTIG